MQKLPKWVLTGRRPAFYDTESATALEQTAKVYGAMQELIDEYNTFVDEMNAKFEELETETGANIDEFKIAMSQQFQDFIDVVELKLQGQDAEN